MQSNIQNFGQFIFGLRILFFALLSGVVLFAAVSLVVEMDGDLGEDVEGLLVIVGFFTSVTMAVLAIMVNGSFLHRALERGDRTIHQKLQTVTGHKIVAVALAEGPGFFWLVLAMITGNRLYVLGGGFAIALILFLFPSAAAIEDQLEMSEEAIERELQGADE